MIADLLYGSQVFLSGLPIVWMIGSITFVYALMRKNNGYADVVYPIHFMALGTAAWIFTFLYTIIIGATMSIATLVLLMTYLWGMRLSLRIARKNRGKPEDFRYATWRREWKWFRVRSYFQIYLLQGVIASIIALPVTLTIIEANFMRITFNSLESTWIVVFIMTWVTGFFFESIGDRQLDRFLKREDRPRIMTEGLWKYTRHPNYFGEALMWWSLAGIACIVVPDLWYFIILSPILITFLLTKVSGIPMLEAKWAGDPEWEEYRARTNALIPWFPKKRQS